MLNEEGKKILTRHLKSIKGDEDDTTEVKAILSMNKYGNHLNYAVNSLQAFHKGRLLPYIDHSCRRLSTMIPNRRHPIPNMKNRRHPIPNMTIRRQPIPNVTIRHHSTMARACFPHLSQML